MKTILLAIYGFLLFNAFITTLLVKYESFIFFQHLKLSASIK